MPRAILGYVYGHVFPVNLLHTLGAGHRRKIAVPGEGRGMRDLMEPRGLTLVAKEMRGTQEPGHRAMIFTMIESFRKTADWDTMKTGA